MTALKKKKKKNQEGTTAMPSSQPLHRTARREPRGRNKKKKRNNVDWRRRRLARASRVRPCQGRSQLGRAAARATVAPLPPFQAPPFPGLHCTSRGLLPGGNAAAGAPEKEIKRKPVYNVETGIKQPCNSPLLPLSIISCSIWEKPSLLKRLHRLTEE